MRMESGEGSTMKSFIIYTIHLILNLIKSRRLRWTGHEAIMEEGRSAFKILTGKTTEKRFLGRPRRRWEGNRMSLKEIAINTRNRFDSAQDRD